MKIIAPLTATVLVLATGAALGQSLSGVPVRNLPPPVNPQDAATKAYVDATTAAVAGPD
jgi:hypothetical protein